MNGLTRTVLNSTPVQKMYEEGLIRNVSRGSQSGAGLLDNAVGGLVGKIVKKVMPKTSRKRRRKVSHAVKNTVGQVARVLQRGRGRKRSHPTKRRVSSVQKGRGRRRPIGPRIVLNRKPATRRRKLIKGRGKRMSTSRKQAGSARRRHSRSRAVQI